MNFKYIAVALSINYYDQHRGEFMRDRAMHGNNAGAICSCDFGKSEKKWRESNITWKKNICRV